MAPDETLHAEGKDEDREKTDIDDELNKLLDRAFASNELRRITFSYRSGLKLTLQFPHRNN